MISFNRIIDIRHLISLTTKGFIMQWTQQRDIIEDMSRKPTRSFDTVFVGDVFLCNGTLYQKRSSRTAHLFGMPNAFSWFSKKEQIQK